MSLVLTILAVIIISPAALVFGIVLAEFAAKYWPEILLCVGGLFACAVCLFFALLVASS